MLSLRVQFPQHMKQHSDNRLLKVLWNYLKYPTSLHRVDVAIALGSNDLRVADRAAEVMLSNLAPRIVCTGGIAHSGDLLETKWNRTEAEMFAERIASHGVPREKIILEMCATNSGENIIYTRGLLWERWIEVDSVLLVQKPYMERRAVATCKKMWSGIEITVTSPQISFEDWMSGADDATAIAHIMVGDMQRMREYPKLGYQTAMEIPTDVWCAYEELVARGYTKHLVIR